MDLRLGGAIEQVGSGTERARQSDEAKKKSETNGRFIRVSISGVAVK